MKNSFLINEKKGKKFILIYNHTIEGGGFIDEEEALYSLTPGKYSILKLVDDRFKTNDVFEFILEYPKESIIIHWSQDLNPILELNYNITSAKGFQDIEIEQSSKDHFKGLTRRIENAANAECIPTLLCGMITVYWYYSIGEYEMCDTGWDLNSRLPSINKQYTNEVLLWLRLSPNLKKFICTNINTQPILINSGMLFSFLLY